MSLSVAVVTPSIGADTLKKCVESVAKQTYSNLVHHIFVDGKQNLDKIREIISEFDSSKYRLNVLDENIGKGWYGHRVYAACSFLVNQDAIAYLDEDNWLEPNHVETLVKSITDHDWAYSLRKVFDKDENYFCDDNCESLGKWPVYFNEAVHHIDTSSFLVKRQVAISIGHSWYGQWGADRQFFNALKTYFNNYNCNNQHTLCYRLGGNDGSVTKDFFVKGNSIQIERYKSVNNFPWLQKRIQVGPGISIQMQKKN
jgi:glycosyltransferase involved in cell wall biosynthesis